MDERPTCPACGTAYYSNMFCLACLNWQIDNYPDAERVEIVCRLRESVMKSATIRIEPITVSPSDGH